MKTEGIHAHIVVKFMSKHTRELFVKEDVQELKPIFANLKVVEKVSITLEHLKLITGFILERNHINAMCVDKSSSRMHIWRHIWEFILEKYHTNVIFVYNSLNIWHLKQAINVSENHLAKYIVLDTQQIW